MQQHKAAQSDMDKLTHVSCVSKEQSNFLSVEIHGSSSPKSDEHDPLNRTHYMNDDLGVQKGARSNATASLQI